jgi:uncharacterized membrane protein
LLYTITLYLHILSAIIATGPLFGIFPLLNRMQKAPEDQLQSYVVAIQGVLRAVANGGHVLVPTGLLLIWFGGWSFTSSWILATIAIMLCSLFFMARAFKPSMRFAQSDEFTKERFIKMVKTATYQYILLMGVLLWLMVDKPMLW